MCQRSPGPRCASHARKAVQAAAKDLKTLETQGANEKTIKKAQKSLTDAVKVYDSTPTGQKNLTAKIDEAKAAGESIRSLSARRTAGRLLREKQEAALAAVVAEERRIEGTKRRLEELREETLNRKTNPYRTAVESYVLEEGVFHKENFWGGPTEDYHAGEHLKQCGVAHTGDTNESYSWSNYDTFNSEDKVGFAMDTTCNCGQILEQPMIVEGKGMDDVMRGLLKV